MVNEKLSRKHFVIFRELNWIIALPIYFCIILFMAINGFHGLKSFTALDWIIQLVSWFGWVIPFVYLLVKAGKKKLKQIRIYNLEDAYIDVFYNEILLERIVEDCNEAEKIKNEAKDKAWNVIKDLKEKNPNGFL